ncbi:MAG: hypothetical protein AB3N15_05905 [Paracoccaceae bacterium]
MSALMVAGTVLLVPLAVAAEGSIAGTYSVQGRNPDGQAYGGLAHIAQDGSFVNIEWRIADESFKGAGAIDGKVLTVDWGAEFPVVYVVMNDGELHGTWADGLAFDKLTPQ